MRRPASPRAERRLAGAVGASLGALLLALGAAVGAADRSAGPPLAPVLGEPTSTLVRPGDTLLDIAFRNGLGFDQVARLNPHVDVWVPEPGTCIELPTRLILPDAPHRGLVINIPEMRLYDFTVGEVPEALAIAVGDAVDPTPVGEFRIGTKRAEPVWWVPDSIRAERPTLPPRVPPGPDNPLGDRWMTLGTTSYGIHGTNNRWSIGRVATHGCVRLHNSDMRRLFDRIPEGTPVTSVYQPVKLGRRGSELFLEVHPDLYGRQRHRESSTLVRLLVLDLLDSVDRDAVHRAIDEARGVPVRIGSLAAEAEP